MLPDSFKNWQSRPNHFSSVKVQADRSLIAASLDQGIYHMSEQGDWSKLSEGLPDRTTVNRLQVIKGRVYACTSQGLYRLHRKRWQYADISQPCYQFKEEWRFIFVATQNGLIYKAKGDWQLSAFENAVVYDFLFTPQYLYIALDKGIAMYDRLTDRWATFELKVGVTSLAAERDRLVGSGEKGELIVSNGQGGFETIQFGGIFVFAVATKAQHVYVCTDKGLFRLGSLHGRITLFSIKAGVPVTDIDWHGTDLYMATLSKGIQTMRE
ncbi:hypothetical protein [Paenibacillus spongiae]|uniref:WD40 repeat domain-containing protein n=1 Tax=Paenibacillus spongiae TaxID=2909671 RepID=A0ABY5S587_9BACL|nr:hypothetical protein [Paenibacillus spongiae]UVI28658.1 hypothetical protein L1F29_24895 [Paenibacillus spongiae]